MLHERDMKITLIKFPILARCSTQIMEKITMLLMGATTIHPGFHMDGIPRLCEQGDRIDQTKRYNGVYSRDQPRVIQHYEHHWF